MSRQKIAAEQIEEAIRERGLTRKQFAELMDRNPSEVTKWLGGKHNFTIALLQEISDKLGIQITGVENISRLVDGYTEESPLELLQEPASTYGADTGLTGKIRRRSAELGISARMYLERLVEDDIRESRYLPKLAFPLPYDNVVEKYSGIIACPTQEDLDKDERLARIWNR